MSKYFDDKELFLGPKMDQYGSHMIISDVKKPIQTKYLYIDTKFRDDYSDDFKIDYNLTLDERINEIRSLYLTNIEIPITFFNISEDLENNVLKVIEGSNEHLITIPNGQYSESSLINELVTQSSGKGLSFSPTSANITVKTTITASSDITVVLNVDKYGSLKKKDFTSTLGWLLGFRKASYTIASGSGKESESFINIKGPKYLYLTIDEFNGRINRSVLGRIQMDNKNYSYGEILPANVGNGYLKSELRLYPKKNDILRINLKLMDEYGHIINLNGENISLALTVEFE